MTLLAPSDLYARVVARSEWRGDCLVWTGCKNSRGYGLIGAGERGRTMLVHRVAVMASGRDLSADMTVDHLCFNKQCVNPDHLEVVTRQENSRRGNVGPSRQIKKTCPKGHAKRPRTRRSGRIAWECFTCNNERRRSQFGNGTSSAYFERKRQEAAAAALGAEATA